jgi:hypothetical protein
LEFHPSSVIAMPDIRQWFIPAEGIERQVISADIQRYLGNDATVRPGQGNAAENNVSPSWSHEASPVSEAISLPISRAFQSRDTGLKRTATSHLYVVEETPLGMCFD